MDTPGKNETIKRVSSGINPQGCEVFALKQPTSTELNHAFLGRHPTCLPERGHVGIFNRSCCAEVLIVRVNPTILRAEATVESHDRTSLR